MRAFELLGANARRLVRLTTVELGALMIVLVASMGACGQVLKAQPPPAPAPAAAVPVPPSPDAAPVPISSYSPKLGIQYQLVRYGRAYGARLVAPPYLGSPMAQSQIQLEAGDMITALDDMPITGPNELETHVAQTKVTFVNIRTGQIEARWAVLSNDTPGPVPPSPPGRALGVYGVTVTVRLGNDQPAAGMPAPGSGTRALRITQVVPGSPAAIAGLRSGDTILTASQYAITSIPDLRSAIANSGETLPMTILDAYHNFRDVTAYLGDSGVASPPPVLPLPAPAPAASGPAPAPVP